jgi:hypothetical protein
LDFIQEANDDVLVEQGFWIVRDMRVSASLLSGTCNSNMKKILNVTHSIILELHFLHFRASTNASTQKAMPCTCLLDFIMKSLAMEHTIESLMIKFIGEIGDIVVFSEVLFYNILDEFNILYKPNLDLCRHFRTRHLGLAKGATSLINDECNHL